MDLKSRRPRLLIYYEYFRNVMKCQSQHTEQLVQRFVWNRYLRLTSDCRKPTENDLIHSVILKFKINSFNVFIFRVYCSLHGVHLTVARVCYTNDEFENV